LSFDPKDVLEVSKFVRTALRASHQCLTTVFQNVDRSGDDVRRLQPASAGAYPLATLGPKLRSRVGLQHFADRVDLPHLVHELLPEPTAVRLSIAQLSQGYVGITALQRVEEQRRCPGDGVCQL